MRIILIESQWMLIIAEYKNTSFVENSISSLYNLKLYMLCHLE